MTVDKPQPPEAETEAMYEIAKALDTLNTATQGRVLKYMVERYRISVTMLFPDVFKGMR
jgi:hypothetical protein